jgi:hypothetical protein
VRHYYKSITVAITVVEVMVGLSNKISKKQNNRKP